MIMTVRYSYVDSWAQAETYTMGDNSNDPEADHRTGQDQHRNGHLGILQV